MMEIHDYNGLEIMPCREFLFDNPHESFTETCSPEEAQFWTVYGTLKWGGAMAFEDHETKEQAEKDAKQIMEAYPHLQEKGLYHPHQ